MRGCSSEWSDLIGPCYLQCLAQALVVCVTRLLSVRFESLGPRLRHYLVVNGDTSTGELERALF